MTRRSLAAACALLLYAAPIHAQAPEPLALPRLQGPIQLDGRADDPAWQQAASLPMTMHLPTFRGQSTEATEVRVGHDDAYLYAVARLLVSDPALVQATSRKRDDMGLTNDWFCLNLDTFRDEENLLAFCTTPAGIRTDFAVFADAEGVFPANVSWNTFWDVEVQRDSAGWYAEMRIPLSSLRFQEQGGLVTMGMIAWRYAAQTQEVTTFPAIEPKWGFWSTFKPSQAGPVTMTGVSPRSPAYITPYLLGGYGRVARREGVGYAQVGSPTREVGLDIKYGLSSNLTLDLTVNTDFAQVEADDQQVNLTRFSLFFPEKRQFFQERANILGFSTGGSTRLFYSRRIGLHEGAPVPILGGARVIGRVGAWDVGFLDMQTAAVEGLPSENMGVARLRRQLFNANSWLGGMMTSRIGADGGYNLAYGLDGSLRLFGDDYLAFAGALTQDDDQPEGSALDPTRLFATWDRRTQRGFGYSFGFSRSGPTYHPALGFEARRDYTRLAGELFRGWIPGPASPIRRHRVMAGRQLFLTNDDRALESSAWTGGWEGVAKSGAQLTVELRRSMENLQSPFRLASQTEVPAGRYLFNGLAASFYTSPGGLRGLGIDGQAGDFYDGTIARAAVSPYWTVSEMLTLSSTYEQSRVRFPDRGAALDTHIARLKADAALTSTLSAAAFAQYSSAADAMGINVRVRYNPREGNDLYLVYNEGVNTDLYRLTPALPRSGSRTLLVKYSHTLRTQ